MATQIIKLADNKVELKTTNVYVDSRPRQPSFSQGGPPRTSVSNPPPPPPPPPPAPPPAAPPARPPPGASTDLGGDLLLDLDDEAAAPAPAARADVLSLAGSAGSGRGASATAAGSATTAATSLMDDLVRLAHATLDPRPSASPARPRLITMSAPNPFPLPPPCPRAERLRAYMHARVCVCGPLNPGGPCELQPPPGLTRRAELPPGAGRPR